MTPGGGEFRTPEQEVSRLLDELAGLRDQLRGIGATLGRLELRIKRAFPNVAAERQSRGANDRGKTEPSLTPEKALQLYDDAVKQAKLGSQDRALAEVQKLALPDLAVLHRELGLSLGRSKPSRKILMNGIINRIKQSVMLSQHTSRE